MPEDSTAFSSLEPHPRSKEGINGSLTPARRQRRLSYDRSPLAFQKIADDQKRDNATAYPSIADQNPLPERRGSRGYGSLDANSGPRLAGGEGISLQETEARIHELERSEFDLKMRLFYAEEQLEDAAGRADAVQLHREVADAKRVGFELAAIAPSRSGNRVEPQLYVAVCLVRRCRCRLRRRRREIKPRVRLKLQGNKPGNLLSYKRSFTGQIIRSTSTYYSY